MNKKLLALAIGAAVAMPVSALADGPTLYGKISASLEMVEDEIGIDADLANDLDPNATANEGWVVRDNESRVGIKGSAETGIGGLKGIYKAEFGLEADGDADVFTQRDIWVGLNGGFGTVLLGNMDTPTKTAQGKVDQFNDTAVDMKNHVSGELRAPNVVAYATPKFADAVTATIALWQAEGVQGAGYDAAAPTYDTLQGPGDAISASVVFDNGNLFLSAAMDMDIPANSGIAQLAGEVYDDAVGGPGFSLDGYYVDTARLVAGYSTDAFEVGFLYGMNESTNTGVSYEDTSIVLSGAFKAGDWKFKAQVGQTDSDDLDGLVTGSQEVSMTMMGLGADYALGKSTNASFFYAVEEAEASGFDATGAYTNLVDGSGERTIVSFGLEQKF